MGELPAMAIFNRSKIKAQLARVPARRHTILLVDDEVSNLRALSALLEREYNVLTAESGTEALAMIGEMTHPKSIHMIISDQRMPGLTGIAFFEKITAIMPRTVRILLTAFQDIDAIMDAVNRAQIYKYMLKPYDRDVLLLTVKRALELYDAQAELEAHRVSLERLVETRTRALVHQARYSALGTMILGMADRLKNPLNFVSGLSLVSAELLAELEDAINGQGSPADIPELLADLKENIALIYKNGNRLNGFVERMMLLSREDRVAPVPLDIQAQLMENADLVEHRFHAADAGFRIKVSTHFDKAFPVLTLEPQGFSRALGAVFNNAAEALYEMYRVREGFVPQLELTTRCDADRLTVCIRDNGVGIDPAYLGDVFAHFFTTKSGEQGHVGLGLGMALDYFRELGGDMAIHSDPGHFTEVVITLPTPNADLNPPATV